MKLRQIVLSQWNRFLKLTGLASIIEILVLTHKEVKRMEGKK